METRAPYLYKIADFITREKLRNINPSILHQANRVIADTMGTAYSGVNKATMKFGGQMKLRC